MRIKCVLYYFVVSLFLFANIYNMYPNVLILSDYVRSFYVDFIETPLWFILWFLIIFLFPFQEKNKKKFYVTFFVCLFFVLLIKLIALFSV